MSRHNRRRTRGGHKASAPCQHDAFELPPSADPPDPKLATARHGRRNPLSAKHWHSRYLAWQAREKKQREESERLKEERKRIFGGDGNNGEEEEEGLCLRMMDYFARLDYLE